MGTFLAALLAFGGTVITGVLSNNATKEAQEEARKMYQTSSANEDYYNKENLKLSKEQARLNKQQVAFARDAELYARGERATERGMKARQDSFAQGISLLNSNETLKQTFLANWKRS
jgi:hypothetical protein